MLPYTNWNHDISTCKMSLSSNHDRKVRTVKRKMSSGPVKGKKTYKMKNHERRIQCRFEKSMEMLFNDVIKVE